MSLVHRTILKTFPRSTERAHGPDFSKYNVRFNASVRSDPPINFVTQRTSYGTKRDESLETLYKDIMPIGVKMAYHYFSTGARWQDQVDAFLEYTDGKDYLAFWLDYEPYYNNLNRKSAEDAGLWIEKVEAATKLRTGLYTSPSVFRDRLKPYVEWPKTADLWIARYWFTPQPNGDPDLAWWKLGRTDWDFWQYTDSGDPKKYGTFAGKDDYGEYKVPTKGCDLNVFKSDYAALLDWLGFSEPEPEHPKGVRRLGQRFPKPL